MSISGHFVSKKRSSRNTLNNKSKKKTKRVVQEGLKNDFDSLQVENDEEGKPVLGAIRPRKRKGSTQESQPSKKRNIVVYNSADSSDDDDAMFISTMKPIVSEDDKKEMDEVLGGCNASDESINETEYEASKEIIDLFYSILFYLLIIYNIMMSSVYPRFISTSLSIKQSVKTLKNKIFKKRKEGAQ